jgi:hypothetical protein
MSVVRRFTLPPQARLLLLLSQVAPLCSLTGCFGVSDLPRAKHEPATPVIREPVDGRDDAGFAPPVEEDEDGQVAPISPGAGDAATDASMADSSRDMPGDGAAWPEADAGVDAAQEDDPGPPEPVTRVYGPHVTVLKSADQKWTAGFGPGRYRASRGDFAMLGGKVPRIIQVPQAVSVLLCARETDGRGEGCFVYAGALQPAPENISDELAQGVAYMEVEPHVLRYHWNNFEATSTRMDAGTKVYLAPLEIRSLLVPPGLRIHMCKDAARTDCTIVDRSVPNIDDAGLGRYVEVLHVVTAFDEPYGDGERKAFGLGTFSAADSALGNGFGSLFVPYPLQARVCSVDVCQDYDRSQLPLPEPLAGKVTELQVESGIVR